MLIYNTTLCLIILAYFYSEIKKRAFKGTNDTFIRFFIFLALWLLSGLRGEVGADYIPYKIYFENINSYSFNNPYFEKGYYILNWIISLLTNNSQYVFLVTSFITIFFITRTLKNHSLSYLFSIFLFVTMYFYYTSFNLIRQYIAMAIVFYSVKYIINKDFKKYFFFIIIASFFHESALFILPFYWILRIRFNYVAYILILLISVALTFITSRVIGFITGMFLNKYEIYTNYSIAGSSTKSVLIITSLILIFSLINKNKLLKIDKNSIIYINAVFFSLIISFFANENILLFRLASYFYMFCLLLIPICIKSLNYKLRPAVVIFTILIMSTYNVYLLGVHNSGVFSYVYNLDINLGK